MISFNKLLANGDRPVAFLPRNYRTDTGKPGVLVFTGTGTSWNTAYEPAVLLRIVQELTERGHPVLTSDLGIDKFANDRAQSGVTDALAWFQSSAVGAKPGSVHLAGFSQGGANALAWIGNNRSKALSFTGWAPLTDLNQLNEADAGTKAFLDNAYPPQYVEATHGSTHNPLTMAQAGKYTNLPMTLCTSSNDQVVPASRTVTFKNVVGSNAKLIDLGPVGHDNSVPNQPQSIAALITQIGS